MVGVRRLTQEEFDLLSLCMEPRPGESRLQTMQRILNVEHVPAEDIESYYAHKNTEGKYKLDSFVTEDNTSSEAFTVEKNKQKLLDKKLAAANDNDDVPEIKSTGNPGEFQRIH